MLHFKHMSIKTIVKNYFPKVSKKLEKIGAAYHSQNTPSFTFIILCLFKKTLDKHFFLVVSKIKSLFKQNKPYAFKPYSPIKSTLFPPVTIIIPFRDKVEVLKVCIESILEKTSYPTYSLMLVDNQSVQPETKIFLDSLRSKENIQVVNYDKPFNYAALHNHIVNEIENEYILFLNSDTEVITKDWLEALVSWTEKNDVGAVGALLLYPDKSVQHAGVTLTNKMSFHVFAGELVDGKNTERILSIQEYSAITGACLMTKKSLFKKIGGMDEALSVTFNDVDYCLRLRSNGYKIMYTPYAQLIHHESYSRGYDWSNIRKYKRELQEKNYFFKKWKNYDDPFLIS